MLSPQVRGNFHALIGSCGGGLAAALFCALSPPVLVKAQTEMDRAESDLRSSTPPSAGATIERRAPDDLVVTMPSDITFAFNSADIRYQFEPVIRNLARTLDRHPGLIIDVVGHADAIGSDDYNQRLSERRATQWGPHSWISASTMTASPPAAAASGSLSPPMTANGAAPATAASKST